MAIKSKASTKSTTGKRYTDAEKAEVLNFIEQVNSEKGRGGQSAAAKKFGISQLTIATWLKTGGVGKKPGPKWDSSSLGSKLASLAKLHGQIVIAERELAKLRASFAALKASL